MISVYARKVLWAITVVQGEYSYENVEKCWYQIDQSLGETDLTLSYSVFSGRYKSKIFNYTSRNLMKLSRQS